MGYDLSVLYLICYKVFFFNSNDLSITSIKLFYFIFIITFDISLFQITYKNVLLLRFAQRFLPESKLNI